jgi:hypothetical protein
MGQKTFNMKNIYFITLCTACFFLLNSCTKEKNDRHDSGYEIEYKIVTDQLYATSVKYTDANGNLVEDMTSWLTSLSKKIRVSQKPFTAKLIVISYNSGVSTSTFDLVISVNGVMKKLVTGVVPVGGQNETQAEFLVE